MNPQQFLAEAVNVFRRVRRSDFQHELATPAERAKLAASPVPLTDPLVQNFAVWRKSMLWAAAILLGLLSLLKLITLKSFATEVGEGQAAAEAAVDEFAARNQSELAKQAAENFKNIFGAANIEVLDGVNAIMILSSFVGAILITVAAFYWHHLPRSKNLARIGWLIMFLTPFGLSIIPVTSLVDWDIVANPQVQATLRPVLAMAAAVTFFTHLGPKAISLFSGTIRSSATLKMLLPEASSPGWAAVLMAPLYSLFLVVITAFVLQMQGNVWLVLGLLCAMTSPLVYLWKAGPLVRPNTPEEMNTIIQQIRLISAIVNALAAVFLFIFMLTSKFFDFLGFVEFILGLGGSLMALTVVAADFILALIYKGYEQSKRFQGTAWQAALEARFAALASVGFTQFSSSVAVAAPATVPGMPAPPTETIAATQAAAPEISLEATVEAAPPVAPPAAPPPPPSYP